MISITEHLLSEYPFMREIEAEMRAERTHVVRKQFHVVPYEGGWIVESEGALTSATFNRKTGAVQAAIDLAHNYGEPCQVIVHKRNGKIQLEWTYPRSSDPRATKG